jgi:CHAD domain-containing protein/CYTH domain-containing protein
VPDYPTGLLAAPPAVAVDRCGATLLGDALEARERLAAGDTDQALHDFRVAVRRLRSVLRAFKPYVDHEITVKVRRRLRDLARATNAARDTEVLLEWVRGRLGTLTRSQRVGGRWHEARLAARLEEEYALSLRTVRRRFPALERAVRKRLAAAAQNPWGGSETGTTFAAALMELIADHLATLTAALDEVEGPDDEARAHAARIHAKRLRYLVELLEREFDAATPAVVHLKALQTLLGELHDVQVAEPAFRAASEVAAAEHALRQSDLSVGADERARRRVRQRNAVPGLLALNRLGREARVDLFEQFRAWRDEHEAALEREVQSVLEGLRQAAPSGIEIERKYLLRSLPERAAAADAVEVEQGWLPGERLQERLRRTTGPDGDRLHRTVKSGQGLSRMEVEEETTADLFDRLWPLTESRRVRKRRYFVPEGALTWEIDDFQDRELVLAEVELPSTDTEVPIPDWIAEVLEREVTGDPQYLNVNLAR